MNFEGGGILRKNSVFEILIFKTNLYVFFLVYPTKGERKIKNMNEIFESNAILTKIQSESCNYLQIYHQNHPRNLYLKEM